jgi:hypothetical protein
VKKNSKCASSQTHQFHAMLIPKRFKPNLCNIAIEKLLTCCPPFSKPPQMMCWYHRAQTRKLPCLPPREPSIMQHLKYSARKTLQPPSLALRNGSSVVYVHVRPAVESRWRNRAAMAELLTLLAKSSLVPGVVPVSGRVDRSFVGFKLGVGSFRRVHVDIWSGGHAEAAISGFLLNRLSFDRRESQAQLFGARLLRWVGCRWHRRHGPLLLPLSPRA